MRAVVGVAAPRTVMPVAKEAALKALALDETVADAHAALAFVLHYYDWDWAGAEREYRRTLELKPGDVFARPMYAVVLAQQGRADVSVAEARTAVESDPISPFSRFHVGWTLVMARKFENAITESRAGIELDPSYHMSHLGLGLGLAGLGRYEEAVQACRQATVLTPGDAMELGYLGWVLGLAGHQQEALTILEDLKRRRNQEYVGGNVLALVSLGLGDHDQAISWLERAAEERDGLMAHLNALLPYDPLRSDPRFQALLKKMNFPPSADQPSSA